MSDNSAQVPQHVAIIMDGNGRWAQKRLMPRTYGHKKGVEATRQAISFYAKSGVSQLTLFALKVTPGRIVPPLAALQSIVQQLIYSPSY